MIKTRKEIFTECRLKLEESNIYDEVFWNTKFKEESSDNPEKHELKE